MRLAAQGARQPKLGFNVHRNRSPAILKDRRLKASKLRKKGDNIRAKFQKGGESPRLQPAVAV